MSASTATSYEVFTCPACEEPVFGQLSLSFVLGDIQKKEVEAKADVTGLRVSHDCTPKTHRSEQLH